MIRKYSPLCHKNQRCHRSCCTPGLPAPPPTSSGSCSATCAMYPRPRSYCLYIIRINRCCTGGKLLPGMLRHFHLTLKEVPHCGAHACLLMLLLLPTTLLEFAVQTCVLLMIISTTWAYESTMHLGFSARSKLRNYYF